MICGEDNHWPFIFELFSNPFRNNFQPPLTPLCHLYYQYIQAIADDRSAFAHAEKSAVLLY
jgi:hypothetical protein